MKQHWYKVWWCMVCCRADRARVYGPKPADPHARSETYYCGCMDSHFA